MYVRKKPCQKIESNATKRTTSKNFAFLLLLILPKLGLLFALSVNACFGNMSLFRPNFRNKKLMPKYFYFVLNYEKKMPKNITFSQV